MPNSVIEDENSARVAELRVMPQRRVPIVNPDTLETIGWLGNISLSGLMIRSSDAFAYRQVHEVRFELGLGPSAPIEVGIQLIWSKSAIDGHVASGFAIRRIAPTTRARLRFWIDQHRHDHVHRSDQLPRVDDALAAAGA